MAHGSCTCLARPIIGEEGLQWDVVSGHSYKRSMTFSWSRNILVNSRSSSRQPPLKAFCETIALPPTDFGPVDFSHGFHFLINSARKRRCSGVR